MSKENCTPLRRRSNRGLPQVPIAENDDEEERRARRQSHQEFLDSPSSSTSGRRQSLGLSRVAHIPANQMSEKISECIRLNNENKITVKNAFSLEIIDFMTYLIKKKNKDMNLQMASTSLDVSAKIYGFRVDKIYTDILKIIGDLDNQDERNNKEENDQGENDPNYSEESNAVNPRKRKKKKSRRLRNVLCNENSLKGNVEVINPISLLKEDDQDSLTTDRLFQAALPVHANGNFYQNTFNDVIFDTIPEEKLAKSEEMDIPNIKNHKNLAICSSVGNFEFLGWSADESEIEEEAIHSRYQFDFDGSLPADDDFIVDHDDHEVVEGFAHNESRPVEHIVDFREVIASSRSIRSNSEYSYLPSLTSKIEWVGPLYWKVRLNKLEPRAPAARKKRKREELSIDFKDDAKREKIEEKFLPSKNIQLVNVRANWTEDKIAFPKNVHYDGKSVINYYFRPQMHFRIPREENLNTELADEVVDYNYNNDNDVSNYCPDIRNNDYQDEYSNDNHLSGSNAELEPGRSSQTMLIGDNLVVAPAMADKIVVPYSSRSTKIDMHQLNKAMWRSLTKSTRENVDEGIEEQRAMEYVREPKTLSSVYKDLPNYLPASNAEALNLPLAFVSLLSVASKKNLEVKSNENLDDVNVKQN